MSEKQYRSISSDLTVRNATDREEEDFVIEGYFALFDDETELFPGYYESIDKRAFNRALENKDDVKALFDHDSAKVLGRTKSNTLQIRADDKGLFGKIEINKNDTDAVNLYHRVKRGDIDQCSFGFIIRDSEDEMRSNDFHTRITDLDLFEVSVVTFPAYANTSVEARKQNIERAKQKMHEVWKRNMLNKIKTNEEE